MLVYAAAGTRTEATGQDEGVEGGKRKVDKKKEREAAMHAEIVKKYGKAAIAIQMARFFSGMTAVTERLDRPVDTVPDMFFTVSINKPLLSAELRRKLNPIVLKVHSATNMPTHPVHYQQLVHR